MPANKALLIGITGNIGSGKSSFCKFLEAEGKRIIYADDTAHKYFLKQKDNFVQRWGAGILEGGLVSRERIARIVFQNKEELDWLNSQIHPPVLKEFQEIAESSREAYLFFEIPLLFEAGLHECFDLIVMVKADVSTIIRRVMQRDNATRLEVIQRLKNQFPDNLKEKMSDRIIANNGSRMELKAAAKTLLKDIRELKPRNTKKPFI